MKEISASQADRVYGGNALDTVTGSFVGGGFGPGPESGLGNVPMFGFAGALVGVTLRTLGRFAIFAF